VSKVHTEVGDFSIDHCFLVYATAPAKPHSQS